MNEVFETETFSKLFETFEFSEKEWIDKMRDQLIINLRVGKPLRFDWLREKKLGVQRLYYSERHTFLDSQLSFAITNYNRGSIFLIGVASIMSKTIVICIR